jgi:hypothetical protein
MAALRIVFSKISTSPNLSVETRVDSIKLSQYENLVKTRTVNCSEFSHVTRVMYTYGK